MAEGCVVTQTFPMQLVCQTMVQQLTGSISETPAKHLRTAVNRT